MRAEKMFTEHCTAHEFPYVFCAVDRDAHLSTRRSTFKALCFVPCWLLWLLFLVALLVEIGLLDYIAHCATHQMHSNVELLQSHTAAPIHATGAATWPSAALASIPSNLNPSSPSEHSTRAPVPSVFHSDLSGSSAPPHSLLAHVASLVHMSEPLFIAFLCLTLLVLVGFVPVLFICGRVLVGLLVPTHRRIERLLSRLSKLEAFQNTSTGSHHHSPLNGRAAAGLSKALKMSIAGTEEPDAFSEAAHRLQIGRAHV